MCERRDDGEFSELEAEECDLPSELGQIVLIGPSNPLDQAMQAQAFEAVGDLGRRPTQFLLEVSVAQPADGELAPRQGFKEAVIGWLKEVVAFVSPALLLDGLRDLRQGPDADRGIIQVG